MMQDRPLATLRPHLRGAEATAGRQATSCLLLAVAMFVQVGLVQAQEAAAPAPPGDPLLAAVGELRDAGFLEKEEIAARVMATGHPAVRDILTAFLEDRLYFRTSDGQVFLIDTGDGSSPAVDLRDPLTGEPAGAAPLDALTKIGTNNRLRRALRTTIARFDLSSPDAGARLAAVGEMIRTLDEPTLGLLREQAERETDPRVRAEIDTGLALAALEGGGADERLAAIATLSRRLRPEVRNRLAALLEQAPDGTFVEADTGVRRAAAEALASIDRARAFYGAVETLFFGLSLGSVLVLAAIGLAITFGVMGVINMAHGELMMLGAYTTYVVQVLMPGHIGWSVIVAIPAAFVVAGAAGVLIERTIIRFLYGRPLETLLATFGVSLVLQQAVRSVFTALNRSVETPAWMSGTIQLNGALSITLNRLYIVIFTMAVFALLLFVLKRTRLGLEIRAVAQNRGMARALGVRGSWVDALTFGLGAGIAGVAGVALSQLTNVGPNLGQAYIIDSFMVVVFGGVGNLWGTLIGGLSLGVVNKVLEPYAGAVLGKILVLVFLIVFIQRRPRGLFPPIGRAAESA